MKINMKMYAIAFALLFIFNQKIIAQYKVHIQLNLPEITAENITQKINSFDQEIFNYSKYLLNEKIAKNNWFFKKNKKIENLDRKYFRDTRKNELHITLVYIDDLLDDETYQKIETVLSTVIQQQSELLECSIERLDFIGDNGYIAYFLKSESLTRFVQKLCTKLKEKSIKLSPLSEGQFTPHISIYRIGQIDYTKQPRENEFYMDIKKLDNFMKQTTEQKPGAKYIQTNKLNESNRGLNNSLLNKIETLINTEGFMINEHFKPKGIVLSVQEKGLDGKFIPSQRTKNYELHELSIKLNGLKKELKKLKAKLSDLQQNLNILRNALS